MSRSSARQVTTVADALAPKTAGRSDTRPHPVIWIFLGAVSLFTVATYLSGYPARDLEPVGFDIHTYVWQARVIGHAPLSVVGLRPGLPALASILRAVLRVDAPHVVLVLAFVMALLLGLAAAAMARIGFRLAAWTVPIVVGVVSLWPSTVRLVVGYEANLLVLILVAAAATCLLDRPGTRVALALATGLLLAAALAHLVIYAAFLVVVVIYVVLSIPAFIEERRAGLPVTATAAGSMVLATGTASILGGGALFLWLGLTPSSSVDTSTVSWLFYSRTLEELRRIRPRASAPVASVGAAMAWVRGQSPRGRALIRLFVAWLALSGAGVLASLEGYRVPGARFLLFALPIPILVALGIVGVCWAVVEARPSRHQRGRGSQLVRFAAAGAAAVLIATGLLTPGRNLLLVKFGPQTGPIWGELRAARTYLERVPGNRPVVFLIDDPTPQGAYLPKTWFDIIRASVPESDIARTFVYVGTIDNLLGGRPSVLPRDSRWHRDYDINSLDLWTHARPALEKGATVLMVQHFAFDQYREAVARAPNGAVAPGVYVILGPLLPVGALPPEGTFNVAAAAGVALAMLLILWLLGWGFVRAALPAGTDWLDVACLAPATGAGLAALGGFLIAAAGANPAGPLGAAMLAIVAAGGAALGIRGGPPSVSASL